MKLPTFLRDMTFALPLWGALLSASLLTSCVDVEEYPDDARGNMEALWRIMDERYCFFPEKEAELGVNWNDVHRRYAANINEGMTRYQLFEFLGRMIGELRDGHVNLSSGFDLARNWSWHEDYPTNFSDSLQRRYLGTDYRISAGMKYRILDDNTGYIYLASFEEGIGEGNLDEVFFHLAPCQGLILDIRCNGGGNITTAQQLAARFCNQPTFVGTMRHKTGPGHTEFSAPREQWIEPSAGIRWQKPVCVLTNRGVYSAANEFVKYMKRMPRATIIGDQTGGGAGMPYSADLPNGWKVRFSACPMYDAEGRCTESGIAPDIPAALSDDDFAKGRDAIIETARALLGQK